MVKRARVVVERVLYGEKVEEGLSVDDMETYIEGVEDMWGGFVQWEYERVVERVSIWRERERGKQHQHVQGRGEGMLRSPVPGQIRIAVSNGAVAGVGVGGDGNEMESLQGYYHRAPPRRDSSVVAAIVVTADNITTTTAPTVPSSSSGSSGSIGISGDNNHPHPHHLSHPYPSHLTTHHRQHQHLPPPLPPAPLNPYCHPHHRSTSPPSVSSDIYTPNPNISPNNQSMYTTQPLPPAGSLPLQQDGGWESRALELAEEIIRGRRDWADRPGGRLVSGDGEEEEEGGDNVGEGEDAAIVGAVHSGGGPDRAVKSGNGNWDGSRNRERARDGSRKRRRVGGGEGGSVDSTSNMGLNPSPPQRQYYDRNQRTVLREPNPAFSSTTYTPTSQKQQPVSSASAPSPSSSLPYPSSFSHRQTHNQNHGHSAHHARPNPDPQSASASVSLPPRIHTNSNSNSNPPTSTTTTANLPPHAPPPIPIDDLCRHISIDIDIVRGVNGVGGGRLGVPI